RNAGRPDEAEPHLRAAFDAGEPMGAHLLGSLCREQGRPEEAERWYRAAVGEWHTDSLLDLGRLAEESGRPEEAEAFYRWAGGAGVAGAEWRLGNLLLGRPGRQDEGVERLRTAAEGGDMKAALVLAKAGEDRWPEESEAWYRRAAEAKVPGAALELGRFLTARGRFAEAEPWARTAADAGSAKALFLLGGLLAEKLGRPDEGEEAYRGAAEAGFPGAMRRYAMCRDKRGDQEGAIRLMHTALEQGDEQAALYLATFHSEAGRLDEAERWYRHAAGRGVPRAKRFYG